MTTPTTVGKSTKSIGDILVADNRLSSADAIRITNYQEQHGIQFGAAGIELELLTKDDIDFALARQFDYAYLGQQDTSLGPELVAAYKPFSPAVENLRAIRSQLMLRWFNTDPLHKVIAVVSPDRLEGRTFVTANLGIVFTQQGQRTLLIDANLRTSPLTGLQNLFRLGKSAGLSGILSGRAGLEAAVPVTGLQGLFVLPAGTEPPNPQELLGRPAFSKLLGEAARQFDVILVDSPAGGDFADAEIIAARAGAALMIARRNQSLMSKMVLLANCLRENGVALVGTLLNDG